MKQAVLLLCIIAGCTLADTIENGVAGSPEVECAAEALTVRFKTEREFEGHVYVKGHFADKGCRVDATLTNGVNLTVPFTDCDVRRKRSSSPRGIFLSVTMIISFHPMFITKIDKSYNVECFYTEQEKVVTQQFDVSLNPEQQRQILVLVGDDATDSSGKPLDDARNLQRYHSARHNRTDGGPDYGDYDQLDTQVIHGDLPLPVCRYEVLAETREGEAVKFATVGQQVYHQWTCEDAGHPAGQSPFCATVHSCNVKEESGREVQLLDENGCAVDRRDKFSILSLFSKFRYLLKNLEYTGDLTGGQISNVFKFADQPSLFFQCQIRLSVKEGDSCKRSSDNCPLPARGKRSVEEKKSGQEVDVFSQSMTVFEIDDPITPSAVRELGEAASAWTAKSMCVSPLTFGMLIALLASVLIVSAITVGLLCCRPNTVNLKLTE
ncbi:cutl-3 [Pristionchus pacificus]|nr:cutl-3 [Pristionchus pacificus]